VSDFGLPELMRAGIVVDLPVLTLIQLRRSLMLSLSKTALQVAKPMLSVASALLLAGVLSGCGVKGPLETPTAAKGAQQATAQADSGQGKAEGAAPKPHKPFILDGLIR
jgi:predicted small lipoprotein YifL